MWCSWIGTGVGALPLGVSRKIAMICAAGSGPRAYRPIDAMLALGTRARIGTQRGELAAQAAAATETVRDSPYILARPAISTWRYAAIAAAAWRSESLGEELNCSAKATAHASGKMSSSPAWTPSRMPVATTWGELFSMSKPLLMAVSTAPG